MHALLAKRVIDVPSGDTQIQRLRLLYHLLPDDPGVMTALLTALEHADLKGEAQATQAAHDAPLLSLRG